LGFWGLGRREEDGEQDLKWRKKKRKRTKEEDGEQWQPIEIEYLKVDLLQRNQVSKTRVVRYQISSKP